MGNGKKISLKKIFTNNTGSLPILNKWLHLSDLNGITFSCLPLEPLQNLGADILKILVGEEVQLRLRKL